METCSLAGWDHASRARSIGSLLLLILAIVTSSAPAAQSSMDQFMAKRDYAAVPLRVGFRNHLCTNAKINGKGILCMLDTGATDLILDTRRTGGLKLLGKTATPAYGLLGRYATNLPTVWVDNFEIGGFTFSNQQALVSSLHRDMRAPIGSYIPSQGEGFEGVIGMSLLKNVHAWIDCYAPCVYVRVEAPDAALIEGMEKTFRNSGYVTAPAKALGTKLFTEALVNGNRALFMIDTGSFDTVFALDQLNAFGLSNKEKLGQFIDLGGRSTDLKYTRLESLKIAEFELKHYPIGTVNLPLVTKHNDELKKDGLPPLVGIIGPDVLEKSHALIDCSNGRMYVMPEKKEQ